MSDLLTRFHLIDSDHEVLLALIADIERLIADGASSQTLRQNFDTMIDCALIHFRSEENGM